MCTEKELRVSFFGNVIERYEIGGNPRKPVFRCLLTTPGGGGKDQYQRLCYSLFGKYHM